MIEIIIWIIMTMVLLFDAVMTRKYTRSKERQIKELFNLIEVLNEQNMVLKKALFGEQENADANK